MRSCQSLGVCLLVGGTTRKARVHFTAAPSNCHPEQREVSRVRAQSSQARTSSRSAIERRAVLSRRCQAGLPWSAFRMMEDGYARKLLATRASSISARSRRSTHLRLTPPAGASEFLVHAKLQSRVRAELVEAPVPQVPAPETRPSCAPSSAEALSIAMSIRPPDRGIANEHPVDSGTMCNSHQSELQEQCASHVRPRLAPQRRANDEIRSATKQM
jgi:hypothetical protein